MQKKKVIVIGAGFGGLTTAALLAKEQFDVTILEKNHTLGGRAMVFQEKGFTFDMGPSWYMMPEVFERYFSFFGKKPDDYYSLVKLDPKYRIFFGKEDIYDMTEDNDKNFRQFEMIEPGSTAKIKEYLKRSGEMYEIAMKHFLYRNYDSIFDMFNPKFMGVASKLPLFSHMDAYISRFVTSEKLKKILLYTTVFIGGIPKNTPAIYSLMSELDFKGKVFYPQGGFSQVVEALVSLCKEYGVKIRRDAPVSSIQVLNHQVQGVISKGKRFSADFVVSNADQWFTETHLLEDKYQTYPQSYWDKKTVAPSAFIMYLGVKGSLPMLRHHTLLMTHDWEEHFSNMYNNPAWPQKPSLYLCNPSKTDPSVAPAGHENLFVLVPIAPGLSDTESLRAKYASLVYELIEDTIGVAIRDRLVFEKIFTVNDYKNTYNALLGTALGLAPTFFQTAYFRPSNRSKKVNNLYYSGHHTIPGVGVPMAFISGELVAQRIIASAL